MKLVNHEDISHQMASFIIMKDFKKYYIIPAPPEEVFLALTLEQTIHLWTGDKVSMKAEPNTEFSLWGGSITGLNLEFEENKKIVQQWFFGDQEEPSIVTIKLHPHNQGTSVELRHTNIPDAEYDGFAEGWDQSYFGELIDFYQEK